MMAILVFFVVQLVSHFALNQAANSDFQFNFSGYKKQNNDFLLKSCPKDANLNTGQTEQMINRVLQGDALEIPTTNKNLPHVGCVNDTQMGKTVKFTIYKNDNDRGQNSDRQRMEMKANEGSKTLTAKEGNSFIYAWWFKLESQLKLPAVEKFFHIFQIKGVGDNISDDPLISFTLSNKNKFHMRLHYGKNSKFDVKPMLDLSSAKGRWIQVFVEVVFKTSGSIRVILKDEKGTTLLPEKIYKHTMWWRGAKFFRPKWGLYRLKSSEYQTSDSQLFQNIQIWKK